jgi:hypothetical protein
LLQLSIARACKVTKPDRIQKLKFGTESKYVDYTTGLARAEHSEDLQGQNSEA